jgi:hypothetical protein
VKSRPWLVLAPPLAAAALAVTAPAGAEKPTKKSCATANEASQAHRAAGHLLEAREELIACAVPECPRLVRGDCAERLVEVERALPTVVFQVVDEAGNDLTDVTVTDNGHHLADRLDGRAFTLDPGDHALRFEALGMPVVEKRFVLLEGAKGRLERVSLAPPPPPVAVAPPPPSAPPPPPRSDGPSLVPPVLLLSAGVAQLAVGGVLLGLSASRLNDLQGSGCSPTCNPSSWEPWRTRSVVGDVLLVTGGVTAASGIIWWIALPHAKSAPAVGVTPLLGGAALTVRL